MKSYKVNIFCLTAEYHKQLPSEFLNLGYVLEPLWEDDSCTKTKSIVTVIGYILRHKTKSEYDLQKDIITCFKNIKGYFYGASVDGNPMLGNMDGSTDISRVLQMKALW